MRRFTLGLLAAVGCFFWLVTVLLAVDSINPLPVPGSSWGSQLSTWLGNEMYQERAEIGVGANFIVSGCLGVTGAGLTQTPPTCTGYAAGYRTVEAGSITYPDASTCTVILSNPKVGGIVGPDATVWQRVTATHYLFNCTVTTPAIPPGTVPLMKVITAAGSVNTVTDIRRTNPNLAPVVVSAAVALNQSFTTVETAIVTLPSIVPSGNVTLSGVWSLVDTPSAGSTTQLTLRVYRDATVIATINSTYAGLNGAAIAVPEPTWTDVSPTSLPHIYKITAQGTSATHAFTTSASSAGTYFATY